MLVPTPEEREKERALFGEERRKAPHLFEREPMADTDEVLRGVGIELPLGERPAAYLRLMPQDFVVEEINRDESLHTVETGPLLAPISTGDGQSFYGDLVKAGVSTLDVKTRLSYLLGVEEKQIGFAGIKDRAALTAQAFSIRGVARIAEFEKIQEQNFFLKNIRAGKGVLASGDLWGNRFIIILRLAAPLSPEAIAAIRRKIDEMNEDGFWNFFYLQRFGTPRLIGHRLGRSIAQGDYEGAVKMFLTHTAPRELPYFMQIRKEAAAMWGRWDEIFARIDRFPYHFHLERTLIRHLMDRPADFLGALSAIPEQIKMWVYAYDSYLFNQKLSALIKTGTVPMELPLATSFDSRDWEPYKEYFAEDGVALPLRAWKDFPFVRVDSRMWPTLQNVRFHKVEFRRDLAVFAFSLPKGAYATSYLMNLFTLSSGLPLLPGISTDAIDAKAVLGLGALAETLARFRAVLESREEDIAASGLE